MLSVSVCTDQRRTNKIQPATHSYTSWLLPRREEMALQGQRNTLMSTGRVLFCFCMKEMDTLNVLHIKVCVVSTAQPVNLSFKVIM